MVDRKGSDSIRLSIAPLDAIFVTCSQNYAFDAPNDPSGASMLVTFTFENFRSFADVAHLSLIANRADKSLPGALMHADEKKGVSLLAAAAIFGPNAAGKTSVIEALRYMRAAVVHSQVAWSPGSGTRVVPHVLSESQKDSTFEVVIIMSGVRYRYGFSVNKRHFSREWLYSYPVGRERMLFERVTAPSEGGEYETKVTYGKHFSGGERSNDPIRRRTRSNSLFLSALAQDNHEDGSVIYEWFSSSLRIVNPGVFTEIEEAGFLARMCFKFPAFKASALELLRAADANLVDINLTEHAEPVRPVKDGVNREWHEKNARYEIDFVTAHEGGTFSLPLSEQSRGIQRLVSVLVDLIFSYTLSEVLVIDEVESSLHPQIVNLIVDMYQENADARRAQIIFTTHDTQLLNPTHMRRDQIWFVERQSGRSHLYPLTEFSPRNDENLERGYLRGRYGAIPALGFNPESFSAKGVTRGGQE